MIEQKIAMLTRREVIKYVIACLLFGSLVYSSRHINVGSLQLTFLRVMIGTFFLMAIFCCSKFRATLWDYTPGQLVFLFTSGVCIGLSYLIISDSTSKLGVNVVTLTYSLGPGLLLIVSPFLFKESKLTRLKLLGFAVCSIGVVLIDYEFFRTPHGFDVIFDVIVAACFTVVVVYCNRQLEDISGLENAMFQMLIAFIIIFIIYVWKHGLSFDIPFPDSWWIVVAGVLNTGLPVWLYLSSVDDLRADIIAFVGYLRPLTTLFISVVVYGDHMDAEAYVGAFFILGGVAISNFFRREKLHKNKTF